MRFVIRILLLLALFAPVMTQASYAQATPDAPKVVIDKRKLLVPPRNADGSFIETPFREDPVRWMRDKQQNFYRQLSGALRGLASGSKAAAAWTLLSLSFLYGMFHAAGPGHGKAVISAWVLATERELKRGIAIAALSALFQALTAIVIVSALLLFVEGASRMARDVAGFLESASYLMIAGLGLWLLWGTWRGSHAHVAARTAGGDGPVFDIVNPLPATAHVHVHDHGADCDCGHAHTPDVAELKQDLTWTRAISLAFAVGLRPCTGALLVLIFAHGLGLYGAGVLSVLVMGLGVFLTTASIATLAVYAKALALRLAAGDNQKTAALVKSLRVVCGLAIVVLGGWMFAASLSTNPVMM